MMFNLQEKAVLFTVSLSRLITLACVCIFVEFPLLRVNHYYVFDQYVRFLFNQQRS